MAIPFIYKSGKNGRPSALTVQIDGKLTPILESNPAFAPILKALQEGAWEQAKKLLQSFNAYVEVITAGKVKMSKDGVFYDGKQLHNALATRIMDMIRQGIDVEPIGKFLNNLMLNPSESAREELYLFLQACDLPITNDGHFLAYKIVRSDYKDKHTGKMDNSVGSYPQMDRAECNPNRDETCSKGLHFCSKSYISHFSARDGSDHLMQLKINPKNVVSIPSDYNDAKGRACEYLIEAEIIDGEIVKNYRPSKSDKKLNEDVIKPTAADRKITKNLASKAKVTNNGIKLDVAKVKEIKKMLRQNFSYSVIGAKFGVHRRTIERIDKGEAWTNVK